MWIGVSKYQLEGFREPTKDEHTQLFYKTKDKNKKAIKGYTIAILSGIIFTLIALCSSIALHHAILIGLFYILWVSIVTFIITYEDCSIRRGIIRHEYRVLTCAPHRIQVTGEIGQGYRKENTAVTVITEHNQMCSEEFKFNEESPYLGENEEMLIVANGPVYKLLKIEKT